VVACSLFQPEDVNRLAKGHEDEGAWRGVGMGRQRRVFLLSNGYWGFEGAS